VGSSISAQPLLPVTDNDIAGTPASLSCGSMTLCSDDPHSICSLGSMGHTVSRLRDFDNLDMDSPFSGRRPSSHTAYIPEPTSPGASQSSSPRRVLYGEPHLPNFHHDHLHHQGQDQLGVATLQPNTQRRERAREALLRRNMCDFNVSVDSTQTNSGSSRTTENQTDQTVVQKQQINRQLPNKVHRSNHSLHSAHSVHSVHSVKSLEDPNSDDHLSSEDNLSHESYDLLDKEEEAQINTFSENMKTVLSRSELSFDNSLSYNFPNSIPHTPSKIPNIEETFVADNERNCQSLREDLVNSNINGHSKPNSHSSTYSSHQSMNSSGLSPSPLPEVNPPSEPVSILSRRRSSGSGTLSQKSKSLKESNKNEPKSDSRISLRDERGHFLSEDIADEFHGHEIHMDGNISTSTNQGAPFAPRNQPWADNILNRHQPPQKTRDPTRDSGMHENFIFQSPTNIKYFSSQIQSFNSRTLPNRKRREKSPVIFTRGKLSVDCSSNSSSSHASPRISRPKSLDFSVVALQDLPQTNAYSYRDDTIDQQDFEDSSSTFSVQIENNYASSSDVPQTPEMPELPIMIPSKPHISPKPISTFNPKPQSLTFHGQKHERIYDIPEGIEREEIQEANSPISESSETRTVFPAASVDRTKFKSYLEITRKFSSEESESTSHKPMLKILPPVRVLKKVSSTESESAPSNNSHQSLPAVQFDSDTLSLPLDLLSPPMESESSTALVESESLPAPPQFGSNKDDTDIEDEVTPKGEEMTPDSLDLISKSQTEPPEQPEQNKFGFRMKPRTLQVSDRQQTPKRQESTYETRAERMLESQTTVGSFTDDHPVVFIDNYLERNHQIVDLDREPINGKRRENVLLKALDTFDSFNTDHEFPITRRQESMTYEESAESMLERQTTVESFTSQLSTDNDVFFDQNFDNKMQELADHNFGNRRDQILESQSTFESFTTECEVLVTKRQESTYEERAEYLLESQNTIESFTNEVPNEEVFNYEPNSTESNFLNNDDCETQIEKTDENLVADMYVRHLRVNDSMNDESEIDTVPFIDDSFEHDLMLQGMGNLACGTGDRIIYNDFVKLPTEQHVENVFLPPTRSNSNSSFDQPPSADINEEAVNHTSDLTNECLDFPAGTFDMIDPPPPLPPDEFGNFTIPPEPVYYREGYHGPFPPRALSRISEKSSNESASTPSDTPAAQYENNSVSDHEQNYTTSEDNENAPSISSDLPENMAHELYAIPNTSFDEVQVEYCGLQTPPSSQEESPKYTEYTQIDQDTLEEEDLDETNAEEIKTEEQDLPADYRADLTNSITSENEVTNKDSEGSLHDSMEILEDVNTDDHFDHQISFDEKQSLDQSGDSQIQCQWKPYVKGGIKQAVPTITIEKPALLKKPSISLSENSGKYVVTEGSEEVIL